MNNLRIRKLEARVPPPRTPVTLVWMSDGVPSYVLIPVEGELHDEDARKYIEEQDRNEAERNRSEIRRVTE